LAERRVNKIFVEDFVSNLYNDTVNQVLTHIRIRPKTTFLFILFFFGIFLSNVSADVMSVELDQVEQSLSKCRQHYSQNIDIDVPPGDVCVSQLFEETDPAGENTGVNWTQTSYDDGNTNVSDDPRFNVVTKELDVVENYVREQNDIRPLQDDENKSNQDNPHMINFDKSRDEDIMRRAASRKFDPEKPLNSKTPRISAEIGSELSYFKYKEPGLMKEEGMYYGLSGALTSRFPPYTENEDLFNQPTSRTGTTMIRLEGNLSWGEVDYVSEGTGELENIDDRLLEIRGLAGFDYETSDWAFWTPYLGVGYRYLNDDSGGKVTTTGHSGYERESNYYYSPVGAELNLEFENGWSLGVTSEYDIFWYGKQKSHLGDAVAGLSTINLKSARL